MANLKYCPEIDGLRAVAVAFVVLYHAAPRLLPGGFIGVDVFFVISGYLITSLLADEWHRAGRIDFAAFYARRIRRLLPALVVMVVVVMAAALLIMGRHGLVFTQTGQSGIAALLLFSNLFFLMNTGGYFDNPTEAQPFLHLWSLSVEEQFYLIYPALLALLLYWVPGGVPRRLAVISVMSLLLAEYWVPILPQQAFYQMPARFWEFAVGGMVALSATVPAKRSPARWYVPVGAVVIAAAGVWTQSWPSLMAAHSTFPGLGAIPAVAGSALVLLGIHQRQTQGWTASLLRSRAFVALGLMSYSVYLWHWPLLAIDANVRLEVSSTGWRLSLCLLAVGLAWLSWRFIEQPLRRFGRLGSRATILVGLGASLLGVVLVLALMSVDRIPADARRMADMARGDLPRYIADCHFDFKQEFTGIKPASCRSNPLVEPTVALWGDSHAMAWQPFVWLLAERAGRSAFGMTMNSCHPTGLTASKDLELAPTDCAAMNDSAMAWLQSSRVDTLVISIRWPLVAATGPTLPVTLQKHYDEINGALARLGHVRRVIMIGPLPVLKRSAPTCISLGWEVKCAVTRQHHDEVSTGAWRMLDSLAQAHPNVELIDPTEFFCDSNVCPVVRDGYALYWDNNHISATASRQFALSYLQAPALYTRKPHPTR